MHNDYVWIKCLPFGETIRDIFTQQLAFNYDLANTNKF